MEGGIEFFLPGLFSRTGRRACSPAGVGLSKEDQAVTSVMILNGTITVARSAARLPEHYPAAQDRIVAGQRSLC